MHTKLTDDIKNKLLAGDAVFTVMNTATKKRFTFSISQPSPQKPHFVGVLSGPGNTGKKDFLGTIFERRTYRHGRKSQINRAACSAQVFDWFWGHIDNLERFPTIEVWHEGHCLRCGRSLTDPESIKIGLGPTCAVKAGYRQMFEMFRPGSSEYDPIGKDEMMNLLAIHHPFHQESQWKKLMRGSFVTINGRLARLAGANGTI